MRQKILSDTHLRKGGEKMRTEHYVDVKSPFTGGRVKEVIDVEEREFRKEKYLVHVRYYVCEDTGEQFTTTEQDDLFCNDLYFQYRNRHDIPFPEDIRRIREDYGLSYAQLSRLMGFGINQWKQYEEGTVPSESNARLISTISTKDGIKRLIDSCRTALDEKEYRRITSKIDSAEGVSADEYMERSVFYRNTERGIMNGFASFSPEKIKMMVKYLVSKEGYGVCPTKLNKEMFYSDFRHFAKTGHSISGLSYRAIQFGPVPEHFETIYDNIDGLTKERSIIFDKETVRLVLSRSADVSGNCLEKEELETLDEVAAELCPLRTSDVVEKSHKELAWLQNNDEHRIIDYSYAYLLGNEKDN